MTQKLYTTVMLTSISFSIALQSCVFFSGVPHTVAEEEFDGAKFGVEFKPDPSFEGYNETYFVFFTPQGTSQRKYLASREDGFEFSSYPKDESLLKDLPVTVVDTITRNPFHYDRTVAASTLYINPKLIRQRDFDTFKKFVTQSFQNADSANTFLLWLNRKNYFTDRPDSLFFHDTIYALVYADLADLEPEYSSADGKIHIRLGVDKEVYWRTSPNAWLGAGEVKDSVFYYSAGTEAPVNDFSDYTMAGKKFGSFYKSIIRR